LFALEKRGWKPKRDVVFAFWDAEEYGMLGSTQWVLHQLPGLRKKIAAVTYTDSVRGQFFAATVSPGLRGTLNEVLARFRDPATDKTVLEFHLEHGMPGYSDDTIPLSNLAGLPVAQLNYGLHYCMYHSVYDNLRWMKLYCDPDYRYVANLSRMLALYAILLTKDPMFPFRFSEFGEHYQKVFSKFQPDSEYAPLISLSASIAKTGREIEKFDFSRLKPGQRREINALLMEAIESFTEEPNVSTEAFVLRNVASGPNPTNECGGVEIPGIQRALYTANLEMLKTEIARATDAFRHSLNLLNSAEKKIQEAE
jgi:N-acetylated-alpha-linked acidic dipeptidase